MKKLGDFLDGKKMYITALAVAVMAGADFLGYVTPDWVVTLLAAFGIVATKHAIVKT